MTKCLQEMSIPHLFRCPISLDLFTDPVTLSTGQTYDRPCIEKWIADGNLTCPVTMQRLHDTAIVPNHTLRHLIDQWLLSAGADQVASADVPNSIDFSIAKIKHIVQSPNTNKSTRLEILKKIRLLAVESDSRRACFLQLGFFPVLLDLLFQKLNIFYDSELIEITLDCLLSLSPCTHLNDLNMLKNEQNLASLIQILDEGNLKIKTSLCYILEAIATSQVTQDLCKILGESPKILQVLVWMLYSKSDGKAAEAGSGAVCGFCSLQSNRSNAVKEGAVDGLIFYLLNGVRRNVSTVLAALEALTNTDTGKEALTRNRVAVKLLVGMVFRVPLGFEGSEHAVGALLEACKDSPRARVEAVRAGVLTQLLLLLQSQCGSKSKAKARALLKLLRPLWGNDPRVCNLNNAV